VLAAGAFAAAQQKAGGLAQQSAENLPGFEILKTLAVSLKIFSAFA
jgi:hypothetical protein